MPANRSRTLEWRRCLKQLFERGGALEIAVESHGDPPQGGPHTGEPSSNAADSPRDNALHLVWRVRLLGLSEREIVVEQPCALGQIIKIEPGVRLAAILSIGQNRWMFSTTNLGSIGVPEGGPHARNVQAIRLAMPEAVERCQRRSYYRVETAAINLPEADIWPLLDPKSVIVAERACEIQFQADIARSARGDDRAPAKADGKQLRNGEGIDAIDLTLPDVGPRFAATLVNLGGGGVGLRIAERDSQMLAHHKLFWMRIALPPVLRTPICATGKVVHTHMESNHDTYAGLAFDFSFNPIHQKYVVEQICRYIHAQQHSQEQARAGEKRRAG